METGGIVSLVNDIHLEMDRVNCALYILLDLSVAFDTVDHEVLMKCLHDLVGIHRTTLN